MVKNKRGKHPTPKGRMSPYLLYTIGRAYPTELPPQFALNELIVSMLCFFNIFVHAYIHVCALYKGSKLFRKRKDLHRKKSKLSTFRNKNIHHHILLILLCSNLLRPFDPLKDYSGRGQYLAMTKDDLSPAKTRSKIFAIGSSSLSI